MHGADRKPDYHSPELSALRARAGNSDGNAGGHEAYSDEERQGRQRQVIGDRNARLVGQHGDEVGGPNAAAACAARCNDPGKTSPPLGHACAVNQIDGDKAGNEANQGSQQNEAQVMLPAQAR